MTHNFDYRLALKGIQYRLTGMSNDERAYLLTGDSQYPSEYTVKDKDVRDFFAAIQSNPTVDDTDRAELDKFLQAYDDFSKASQSVFSNMKSGKIKEAQSIHFNEERQIRKQVEAKVDGLIKKIDEESVQESKARNVASKQLNLLMLIIFASCVLIATIIGWLVLVQK
ncbi:hypothetical protein HQN89_30070 [Paenibacillus frigoriresistens]|uniref:CHASE3 domain-containing protein n=1 Tax=Paenibacillus alginolyticus TaxID=59839 RepID=UPI00156386D0|nr:hypothetical protein [Paenibacillus frigoriresistens]NRF95136.1 hypothetical protein [Paenibacillus frigoriresistens]